MIKLERICKDYIISSSNKKQILKNFEVEIKEGELVAVIGKSGVGKSTLLNILSGLSVPTSGEYYFRGEKVGQSNSKLAEFRKNHIGIIVQNFALINEWNAFENISLPLKYRKVLKTEIENRVKEVALSLGIEELLKKHPKTLSGGENQRVALARAIIDNPDILIADEPTASLDGENKIKVFQLLKALNEKGMTIIIATHDKEIYEQCTTRILLEN